MATTADPRDLVPPEVLEEAVQRELAERRERAAARRQERREQRAAEPRQPERARYSSVTSGAWRRRTRPTALPEDRQYVPAALRHWRRVHGLSPAQAQARIGYSPKSSTWRQWESGFVAPPYQTLLRIIAATGMGYWTDHGSPVEGVAPEHRLEALTTQYTGERRARRRRRRDTPTAE